MHLLLMWTLTSEEPTTAGFRGNVRIGTVDRKESWQLIPKRLLVGKKAANLVRFDSCMEASYVLHNESLRTNLLDVTGANIA